MAAEERDTTDIIVENDLPELSAPDEDAGEGPPRSGVLGRLFREGYLFDFYQAVRLLEQYYPDAPPPGETSDYRKERILFRPDIALTFPGTDVRSVRWLDESLQARVTLTFMGLYGIGSPLPVYFYDELATDEHETFSLRDFLDIFNHRVYAYFYRAWKKYRPDFERDIAGTGAHARRFLSLAGLATAGALEHTPVSSRMRLAAYAGRLGPRVRNAEGLQALLAGLLGGVGVRVVENVPRWVPIPHRPLMGDTNGGGMVLGVTSTIGASVFDVSGKFRVVLGLLTFEAYQTYLPGRKGAQLLGYLVRLYAPDYLDYDIELLLDTSGIPPVRLGGGDVQLGLTTWLGKPSEPVTVHHVTYS
ncbi:MAG: type VI secretion system baseplate subunit TssG [Rhodothermales bacterium]